MGNEVYEAKQGNDWDQRNRAMKDKAKALRQRDWEPNETTHRQGCHTRQMGLQSEIGTPWSSRQIQSTLCVQKVSNKWKHWTAFRLFGLPVNQRHSRFYFNYQRSKAM